MQSFNWMAAIIASVPAISIHYEISLILNESCDARMDYLYLKLNSTDVEVLLNRLKLMEHDISSGFAMVSWKTGKIVLGCRS